MGFKNFPEQQQAVQLLQRSMERGRLGHAYLFTGHSLSQLEDFALALAKTLNCQHPVLSNGIAVDSCDACLACRKAEHSNHPDIHWVRAESKSRIISVEQMRDLMKEIQLKPGEAQFKVAIIVAADRMKTEAANAFLKTLEEPPARSILILLSTEPQRLIETILSRCLRLNLATEGSVHAEPADIDWLKSFSEVAAIPQKSLLGRYRLLDVLLQRLTQMKQVIDETLSARSPLQQYKDAEKDLIEKWEHELTAAIEAEYRRQRADLLALLHWWLRDVWVWTLTAPVGGAPDRPLLSFPDLPATAALAQRISQGDALNNLEVLEQLQRWLGTNVQEALALEVTLLKLRL
jgi:DNA polymerase-3 subunit delta'